MRNRGRSRRGGRLLLEAGPDQRTILTITDDGSGNALVRCAGPHSLLAGRSVTISGASVAGYNQTATVGSVPSATTWTVTAGYTADSVGGRWEVS